MAVERGLKPVPPRPDGEPPDRLTIVSNIYHEHGADEPFSLPINKSVLLKYSEQPYHRKVKVGPEWQSLDLGGWFPVEQIGTILLENLGPGTPQVVLEKSAQDDRERHYLEVRFSDEYDQADDTIPNGLFAIYRPLDPSSLQVRSPAGPARYRITVIVK